MIVMCGRLASALQTAALSTVATSFKPALTRSEREPPGQLDLPIVVYGARYCAEVPRDRRSAARQRRGCADGRVRIGEARRVEQIEYLGADLEFCLFVNRDVLEQREIPVD